VYSELKRMNEDEDQEWKDVVETQTYIISTSKPSLFLVWSKRIERNLDNLSYSLVSHPSSLLSWNTRTIVLLGHF
jgi:hypothetical protein